MLIKIVEHFLPLFVNTYSASPYRLDFADFHPEKVLGFLPHELDYTHLRMIWRRWKKKADISFLGRTITPFGPRWLDKTLAELLQLKGDLVPDFRLIDYLVTLLSTETCPGLNGSPGNHERLKAELSEMGVFDPRMSIYLLYRQRLLALPDIAGFEGRSYSLFHSLQEDMAEAVDIQNLVTALACRYIQEGKVHHHDIPDQPSIESERRQIFFAGAVGIPTFYVRADTGNRLLRKILTHVRSQRNSLRYKGYVRVKIDDYKLALLHILETDGADLIEQLGLAQRMQSLRRRLTDSYGLDLRQNYRSRPRGTAAKTNTNGCFRTANSILPLSTITAPDSNKSISTNPFRFLLRTASVWNGLKIRIYKQVMATITRTFPVPNLFAAPGINHSGNRRTGNSPADAAHRPGHYQPPTRITEAL